MKKTIEYKNKTINYIFERKKVKNINMRVKDGVLKVSANSSISKEYLDRVLIRKWDWIVQALDKRPNPYLEELEKKYITGEKFLYLGKEYNLKVSYSIKEKVELNKELKIFVKDVNNYSRKKKLLDTWLLEEAKYVFNESLKRNYVFVKDLIRIYPELKIRKMVSRWGSCKMPSGIITLNKNLIKTPIECIDYVMVHELIHLIHQNHGEGFYNMLNEFMPNWKTRKNILEDKMI
ncbi:M48 family metallopeptidase [Miniphocaeibacter massiliensis]|uniref:M48 family metallopeptidase n=1 Tax=Miniphocaeibacter massiliensis TaxID=2041841 RepID=UPI000C1C1F7D|nr:SprT family zinc-dependent metalloprotease [Miniphocaeibacter massiliensis]